MPRRIRTHMQHERTLRHVCRHRRRWRGTRSPSQLAAWDSIGRTAAAAMERGSTRSAVGCSGAAQRRAGTPAPAPTPQHDVSGEAPRPIPRPERRARGIRGSSRREHEQPETLESLPVYNSEATREKKASFAIDSTARTYKAHCLTASGVYLARRGGWEPGWGMGPLGAGYV